MQGQPAHHHGRQRASSGASAPRGCVCWSFEEEQKTDRALARRDTTQSQSALRREPPLLCDSPACWTNASSFG
eukprot:scaffold45753_cov97-Phaeocystis_antarctica.AAC.3